MTLKHYTAETNQQILIALLKAHNIRKVVVSPGTTNITFVGSIQSDSWFEMYSSIDERSAGYIACGMAAESGEPVVLSCTGATASRNYFPALTEAYYRQLPVLAVTASQHFGRAGQYSPQFIDRTSQPKDTVKLSAQIPIIHTPEDKWACTVKINEALLELTHNGGGPVHLNMMTGYNSDFSVPELPDVQVISRINYSDKVMPEIKAGRVAVFVGAHSKWSGKLTSLVDAFCEKYNGAVISDHTGNYRGKYEVNPNLVPLTPRQGMDLMIHIGQISGAYMSLNPSEVWRVNPDGAVRDTFRKLRYVFEMTETDFFSRYVDSTNGGGGCGANTEYYSAWCSDYDYSLSLLPELPFSNAWIAQKTTSKLPPNSVLHLGILNSLRVWNFFRLPKTVLAYSDTGGFGIDGCVSSLLGASLASPDKLFFGVIGDLAFFYDMNSVGNRYKGRNLRLMVINNGCGAEFKIYNHPAMRFGDDGDPFMAARGHFACQSRDLLRHYASDLGFEYMSASNKEEYLANLDRFVTPEMLDKPIFFEIFTDPKCESDALFAINNIEAVDILPASMRAKKAVRNLIGNDNINAIKKIIGRK